MKKIVELQEERNMKIIGVAETRMKGHGRKTIHNDYEFIYSSREDNRDHGVGIILSPDFANSIQDILYKNERIVAVTMKIKAQRTTFIQCYAPQQGRSQEEKELFYANLQEVFDQCPVDSDIVIMGDLNGHVGSTKLLEVIGYFGVGEHGPCAPSPGSAPGIMAYTVL